MRYRKLRIAWSVVWGVVAVVLMLLWVRSYSYHDRLLLRYLRTGHILGAVSAYGAFAVGEGDSSDLGDRRMAILSKPARKSPLDNLGPPLKLRSALPHDWSVSIPIWLCVTAAIVTSGIVWTRFTLRTLLVATTLVAVGLGVIVYAT